MVNATIKPAPYREKSMQCNNAISECKMMLASIMPSVGIIDEVNIAILHQFAVFALVLTTGNLLCQTLILQTLQATTDAASLTFVIEALVNIVR